MNINALSIRRLAVVSSLVLCGVTAWGAASAADPNVNSIRVQLTDLNLATAADRQTAYDRLHQAARRVCERVADPYDVGRSIHVAGCIEQTLAQASVSLAQLVASQSGTVKVAESSKR